MLGWTNDSSAVLNQAWGAAIAVGSGTSETPGPSRETSGIVQSSRGTVKEVIREELLFLAMIDTLSVTCHFSFLSISNLPHQLNLLQSLLLLVGSRASAYNILILHIFIDKFYQSDIINDTSSVNIEYH